MVNHGIGSAHERLVRSRTLRSGARRCASTRRSVRARAADGRRIKCGFDGSYSPVHSEKAERSGSAYTAPSMVLSPARAVAQDAGRLSHIKRSAPRLGVDGNGRALGEVGTEQRGSALSRCGGRAAIYPQIQSGPCEVARNRVPCSDAAGGINGEAITVALGGTW